MDTCRSFLCLLAIFFPFGGKIFTINLNDDDCDRDNGICKTFTTFHAARLWSKNKRYNGFTVIR